MAITLSSADYKQLGQAANPPSNLDSKGIPQNLRVPLQSPFQAGDRYQTRLLLLHNPQLQPATSTRVLVFRNPSGFARACDKQEFHLDSIGSVAPLIQAIAHLLQHRTGSAKSSNFFRVNMPRGMRHVNPKKPSIFN